MVSTLCTMSFHTLSSSVTISKPPMYYVPSCTSCIKALKFPLYARFSQVGLRNFSPWNGLRHVGSSISAKPPKIGRRGKCRGKVVYASLFGVGAPEALVIGVVALLVFGPKGLAEVARNLGKTLRAFQPTIRELQEVSREFKSTLEREISLDDDPRPVGNTSDTNRASSNPGSSISSTEVSQDVPVADPNGIPSSKAYTTEDYLRITEEQLKASAAAQQDVMSSPSESQADSESQSQAQQTFASSPPEQVEPESQPQASAASLPDSLSSPEGQSGPESQPEVAIQESATAAPLEQKSTSES